MPHMSHSARLDQRQGVFALAHAPAPTTRPTFYPTDHWVDGALLHIAPCYSDPLGSTLTPLSSAACPCTTTKQRTPRPVRRGHRHSGPRNLLPVCPNATPSRPMYYTSIRTQDLHKPPGTAWSPNLACGAASGVTRCLNTPRAAQRVTHAMCSSQWYCVVAITTDCRKKKNSALMTLGHSGPT